MVGMRLSPRRDRQVVVRILGLLKTLAEGGRPTVHQLAARFKTRRETIYRDLHASCPASRRSGSGSTHRLRDEEGQVGEDHQDRESGGASLESP